MSKHFHSGQHPDADQISAFVDHALPAHEREDMLAHLAECADCRETTALSLPAMENAPAATAVKKSQSWTWSIRLLWPATAVAAMAAVLIYVSHETHSHKGSSGRGPEVALDQPAAPTKGENATAGAGGAGGGFSSHTGPSGKAKQAQAAAQLKEQSGATGNRLAVGTTQRVPALHLPGGVIAISTVTRGRRVLAIDDRSAVFLSRDGGASWIAVQVPWKGRAVKAELVSYPVSGVAREKAVAGVMAQSGANAAVKDEAENSPDAARFEAQKNLRQELKGSYRAPTDGSGAANGSAPTLPPVPALTAPAPGVSTESQGILTGTITDKIGAVIPGASVAITNPANHKTTTAVTGADGKYRIDGLPAGTYQLEARASGFRATTLSAIPIAASSSNTTNVTLEVGAASETVMVQSEAPEIETTSADLGSNAISLKQKSALAKATRIFEITTDTGDRWTSADGVNWHRL